MDQVRNYQKELDKIIEKLQNSDMLGKRLFLHSCCAPCSSYVLEYLRKYFRITVFYYNPNISMEQEYRKRVEEQKRLIVAYNTQLQCMEAQAGFPIEIIEGDYEPQLFYDIAKGLEQCPEGGERCFACYELRLRKTAELAKQGNYDYFATTLTISPLKNAGKLNEIGERLSKEYDIAWLVSDFKKKNGYKRSIELSSEYDLYRQDYCGCIYSKRERDRQKNAIKEIKTGIYDEFHCIADACPMTCCRGWAIKADGGIYEKWKAKEETAYLCEKVTDRREDKKTVYYMKTGVDKSCVLLDDKGLCEIVKKHGDTCLSDTCANFPRKCNKLTEEKKVFREYSLSGACPAVIDLLWKRKQEKLLIMLPKREEQIVTFPMEYKVRNALIDLLQEKDIQGKHFSLTERLLLGFSLLHECLSCEREEEVDDCIEVYNDKENLSEVIALFYKTEYNQEDAFQEVCQTFYDVSEFYKQEAMYRPYLYPLADYVEELFPQEGDEETLKKCATVAEAWQDFKKEFTAYDAFFTNVLVSEIFADCVSDDLGYLTEAYQAVALEYIMTRLSVFLLENKSGKKDVETVKRFISLYIRIIGHNTEGMAEYWEENFEDSVLEKEYFYMISI